MFGRVMALNVTRLEIVQRAGFMSEDEVLRQKVGELKRSIVNDCPACTSCHLMKVEATNILESDMIALRGYCGHATGGKFPGDMVTCPDGFVGVIGTDKQLMPIAPVEPKTTVDMFGNTIPVFGAFTPENDREAIMPLKRGSDGRLAIPTDRDDFMPPPPRNPDVPVTAGEVW